MSSEWVERSKWIAEGIERGWVNPPVCSTHEDFMSEEELELFWEGSDPCIVVMRINE